MGTLKIENAVFHYDTASSETSFSKLLPLDVKHSTPISENKKHDIINFLQRPVVLGMGNILASASQGALISTLDFPGAFLSHAMISAKVSGFRFFKGTLVVTISLNGTRFQQGRVICTFFPQANDNKSKYFESTRNLACLTQLPNVQMDIATDDQITFRIPYINTELAYDLNYGNGTHGRLDFWIYSPLVVPSGDATCEYTIMAHYEDITLTIPTSTAMVTQSISVSKLKKKKDPSVQEVEDDRPLSTSLNLISQLAGIGAKIPLLSSVAGPTSWFLSKAADTAYSWGFSKPPTDEKSVMVVNRPLRGSNNATGPDYSNQMAAVHDNSVIHDSAFFGTDVDQLAFSSMVGRLSYIGGYTYSTNQTPGTIIASYSLAPNRLVFNDVAFAYSTINPPSYIPTAAAYVASCFKYWRGGFKFRFRLVKTEFHSGRLLVCFNPTNVQPTSLDQANYLYREIVDLRYTNEFCVSVPYVSNSPYIMNDTTSIMGTLTVFVLNQLRAPPTVSQSISVLTEAAMTEDSEFAVPNGSTYVPVVSFNTEPTLPAQPATFVPQSATIPKTAVKNTDECVDHCDEAAPIATSTANDLTAIDSSGYCIGEAIVSARQLLKRSAPYLNSDSAGALNLSNTSISVSPRAMIFLNPGSTYNRVYQVDPYSFFGILFAYNRGSVRLKAIPSNPATQNEVLRVRLDLDRGQYPIYAADPPLIQLSMQQVPAVFQQNVNNSVEVVVPFYFRTHMAVNTMRSMQSNYVPGTDSYVAPATRVQIRAFGGSNVNKLMFWRSAGDDFDFGYYLCTPRVIASNVVSPTEVDGGIISW